MQVMVGNNYGSYSFNATTGVITLSGLPTPLTQEQVKLIICAATNTIIFNLADPTQTAVVSGGNTIALSYNTTGMDGHPLQIFLEVPGTEAQQGQSNETPLMTVIAGLTQDVIPQYQEIPLTSGATAVVTSDAHITSSTAQAGGVTPSQTLLAIAGLTNDPTPQYQEIPLGPGGNAVLVNGSAFTQPISGQYNAVPPTLGSGSVGVLQTDVNGNLRVLSGSIDGTILDTQSSVTLGAGATYNVAGYGFLSFQFNGAWSGNIKIEASNDGVTWTQQYVQYLGTGWVSDVINLPGAIVQVTAASIYMRYNVIKLSGTATVTVVGNTGAISTTSLLGMAFDAASGVQLNTNITNLNKDTSNALILSDAPAPIPISGGIGSTIIIDTQGYESLNITTQGLAGAVTTSNDKVTWSALSGTPLVLGTLVTSVAANTGYSFPCIARFIRFVLTAVGSATVFLRSTPWQSAYTTTVPTSTANNNLSQINTTTVASAGVGGILAVGGNVAPGSAQTAYPLVVGGVDPTSATRRIQTDATGRINANMVTTDAASVQRGVGVMPPATTSQNVAPLAVQELTQFEGQSFVELLGQILTELRISNHYNFNLPSLLTTGTINSTGDEPAALRNDPNISTLFG
jgi:hypothetical protein